MKQLIAVALVVALALESASTPSFQKNISKDREPLHALSRLAWGIRPGDLDEVKKLGLKVWIDRQLNPGGITENSVLAQRLAPLASLNLTAAQVLEHYPPPQRIVAYATGRLPMPQDPEQRAVVERLALRYKDRISKKDKAAAAKLEDAKTPGVARLPGTEDLRVLRKASAEERAAMLEHLPAEQRRKALLNVAPQQVLAHDLQEAKFYRAVYSNRQLEDVLTDFWFNHFNVYMDKGADRYLLTTYERDAIRPHVLGKFRDMLQATAEHPAMLFYLDNWRSATSDMSLNRRGKVSKKGGRGLNENYARELLELHSLGVDGGYSQKDIVEVARCFTGWTIASPYRTPEFTFNENAHDKGEKVVLGVRIAAGGGREDGLKVLELIARHPSTAKLVSLKLAQRFVADNPPPSLIDRMAKAFTKSDGDLRATLKAMLDSREFWSEAAYKSKAKTPFEMVVSALRASGAELTSSFGVANRVAEMGQPLYRKQEPTGYSSVNEDWMGSASLLGRMNFAIALSRNGVPGVRVEGADGLALGSPEFQRR